MGREIEASGDVAKIVVKPHSEENVLTFLNGTLAFRRAHPLPDLSRRPATIRARSRALSADCSALTGRSRRG